MQSLLARLDCVHILHDHEKPNRLRLLNRRSSSSSTAIETITSPSQTPWTSLIDTRYIERGIIPPTILIGEWHGSVVQLLALMDDSIRQHQHSTGNGGDSLNFTLEDLIIVPSSSASSPFSSQQNHRQDRAEDHEQQEEDHNDEEEGDRTEEEEENEEDGAESNEESAEEENGEKNHRFEIDWPCLQIEVANDKNLVSSVTEEHQTSNMNRLKLLLKDRLTQMITEMNHSRDTNEGEGDADDQDGKGRDALVVTATQSFQFYLLLQLHGRLALPTRDMPSVFADPSLRANEIFFRSKL